MISSKSNKFHIFMPDEIKQTIFEMKEKYKELKAFFDQIHSRDMSIAQTNLETAMMWAIKALIDEHEKINASKI